MFGQTYSIYFCSMLSLRVTVLMSPFKDFSILCSLMVAWQIEILIKIQWHAHFFSLSQWSQWPILWCILRWSDQPKLFLYLSTAAKNDPLASENHSPISAMGILPQCTVVMYKTFPQSHCVAAILQRYTYSEVNQDRAWIKKKKNKPLFEVDHYYYYEKVN